MNVIIPIELGDTLTIVRCTMRVEFRLVGQSPSPKKNSFYING